MSQIEPEATARAIVPYCFDEFAEPRSPSEGKEILFVGGFAHPPNQQAVRWFVDPILPILRVRVPDVTMTIVGSNPPPELRALAGGSVKVVANVGDTELREHYRSARVAVVPLRYGAGVKLKVVEALREGVPLVTTSVGAQGLPGLERVGSICDRSDDFAEAVCRLLVDGDLWRKRCAAQIGYAASRYSAAAFRTTFLQAAGFSEGQGVDRSGSPTSAAIQDAAE